MIRSLNQWGLVFIVVASAFLGGMGCEDKTDQVFSIQVIGTVHDENGQTLTQVSGKFCWSLKFEADVTGADVTPECTTVSTDGNGQFSTIISSNAVVHQSGDTTSSLIGYNTSLEVNGQVYSGNVVQQLLEKDESSYRYDGTLAIDYVIPSSAL